ncbi:MAG: hypothetical protein P8J20_02860 [Novosphingobium sp.]|nr:hypothetical protein [Novosphingobium sp.]
MRPILILTGVAAFALACPSAAQDSEQPGGSEAPGEGKAQDPDAMDNAKLAELLKRIDPDVKGDPGSWQLTYEELQVIVITDEKAGRMRILSPVRKADSLEKAGLVRLMQANFDSALDARYAIANGMVWSTFIHPLTELTERELFSGLGQTIALKVTYGTTFSSGALVFQGGDSGQIMKDEAQRYYDDIQEKAQGNTT